MNEHNLIEHDYIEQNIIAPIRSSAQIQNLNFYTNSGKNYVIYNDSSDIDENFKNKFGLYVKQPNTKETKQMEISNDIIDNTFRYRKIDTAENLFGDMYIIYYESYTNSVKYYNIMFQNGKLINNYNTDKIELVFNEIIKLNKIKFINLTNIYLVFDNFIKIFSTEIENINSDINDIKIFWNDVINEEKNNETISMRMFGGKYINIILIIFLLLIIIVIITIIVIIIFSSCVNKQYLKNNI